MCVSKSSTGEVQAGLSSSWQAAETRQTYSMTCTYDKLTPNYSVYTITRCGFGASSYAPLKGGAERLGQDLLAVIRALKINRPVLVGHSIAGVELSSVANLDPKAIAGVI
jgi:pimeloyl-ACP methyl ester carboxylesterase